MPERMLPAEVLRLECCHNGLELVIGQVATTLSSEASGPVDGRSEKLRHNWHSTGIFPLASYRNRVCRIELGSAGKIWLLGRGGPNREILRGGIAHLSRTSIIT